MMKKRDTIDLPEDLVVEILSRVPAISLARFRSISKRWNSLIKDVRFAKTHFANAPRQSFVIMLHNYRVHLLNLNLNGMHDNVAPSAIVTSQFSLKDPLDNCSSEEADICNVIHCEGLLLCTTMDNRLVVWNPCSGETKWIQPRNSDKGTNYYVFGKSSYNMYKILSMRQSISPFHAENEVYDFASDSWRSVGNTTNFFIPCSQRCGVFFKGRTYWLAFEAYSSCPYDCLLLSFDFSTEKFQRQSIPHSKRISVAALSVVREEQLYLLLTHRDTNSLNVWMATKSESTGVKSWSKFLTANSSHEFSCGLSFLPDEQNKVVVCCCDYTEVPNNILHIVGEDRHVQVDHHGAESSYSRLLSYVPTLVQISQVI